ncbi:hypothetical protein [Aminobacterium colombiense]
MRSRNIKPGFFKNEILGVLDPLARILFSGLWCMADREGRLEDRPLRIKIEVLPYDNCDVDDLLKGLQENGFIQRYEVNGEGYIQIVNFLKHQNPHIREKASEIPPFSVEAEEDNSQDTGETQNSPVQAQYKNNVCTGEAEKSMEPARLIPDSLIPDSLIPDSGFPNPGASTEPAEEKTEPPPTAGEAANKPQHSELEVALCKSLSAHFQDVREKPEIFYTKLAEWTSLYEKISVPFEIRKAAQWLRDNPGKKYKSWSRFMGNWLSRSHERQNEIEKKAAVSAAASQNKNKKGQSLQDWLTEVGAGPDPGLNGDIVDVDASSFEPKILQGGGGRQ